MEVCGTKLSMTRGDTENITVSIRNYEFSEGDIIDFTVRKTATSPIILHKQITSFSADGKAIIDIEPNDTSRIAFGNYVYDIQWTNSDGQVTTIVKPSSFILLEEVTYGI